MEIYRLNYGEPLIFHRIHFLKRITNDGSELIDISDEQPTFFDKKEKFTVFKLSLTHRTWVATNGMSTYIVELFNIEGKKI